MTSQLVNTAKHQARHHRLTELEDVIELHLEGFIKMGEALAEVHADKLYKATHSSFSDWLGSQFKKKISRRRAYELMAARTVHSNLERHGAQILPVNERQARELTKLEPQEQVVVWDAATALAGEDDLTERHVRAALRERGRQGRIATLQQVAKGNAPLAGIGPFPVILADCPWQYADGTTDPTRDIENQYPTMPLAEILALGEQVRDISTSDGVLFLWATAPLLPEALQVMEAWGYEYKSNAVWDKMKIGTGYWFRGRHEHLLVGVRGNMVRPSPSDLVGSMIAAKRGAHSEKPVAVHEIIERYYPDLPKLEMFARAARPGWSRWGNQSEAEAEAGPLRGTKGHHE